MTEMEQSMVDLRIRYLCDMLNTLKVQQHNDQWNEKLSGITHQVSVRVQDDFSQDFVHRHRLFNNPDDIAAYDVELDNEIRTYIYRAFQRFIAGQHQAQ